MIRSSLAALLLCAIPLAHAETKKTPAADAAPKADKADKAVKADKAAKPADKPTAREKSAAAPKEQPAKPAAKPGTVDPVDQALLNHAEKELKKLSPAQESSLLKLANDGKPEELRGIPGVGEIRSAAIKEARPIKAAADLILVDGIGKVTFDGIVKWVKDGMPKVAPAAAKPAPKTEAKTETKPAPKAGNPTSSKAEPKAEKSKPAADKKPADSAPKK